MRHFYKAHGRHCYLRSFKTKCPKCGVDVLYWECTHGSKVFFEYPPYGKLVRHFCQHQVADIKKKIPIIVKTPKGLLENASPSCPVCGKLFKVTKDLNNHFKTLKKNDQQHNVFYKNNFKFENGNWNNNQRKLDQIRIYNNKPKFGKINIKKRNEK